MNLQQLSYFQTLAREENFTRASQILSITQPTLSHSIRQLEEELNAQLFIRLGRRVVLTSYGETYLRYVNEALSVLDNGHKVLEEMLDPSSGIVQLGYLSSLDSYVPKLVSDYLMMNPGYRTDFRLSLQTHPDIVQSLQQGSIHLGFSTDPMTDSLEALPLGSHRSMIIVSKDHPWAGRKSASLKELDRQRFVAYSPCCYIRQVIDSWFRENDVKPVVVSEVLYDNLIYGMVGANFGVSVVPEATGVRHSDVRFLEIEETNTDREIFLIWNPEAFRSSAVSSFRDFIVRQNMTYTEFASHYHGSDNSRIDRDRL